MTWPSAPVQVTSARTQSEWPVSGSPIWTPVVASHSRIVLSSLQDASMMWPSAPVQVTSARTQSVWPVSGSPIGAPALRRSAALTAPTSGEVSRYSPAACRLGFGLRDDQQLRLITAADHTPQTHVWSPPVRLRATWSAGQPALHVPASRTAQPDRA